MTESKLSSPPLSYTASIQSSYKEGRLWKNGILLPFYTAAIQSSYREGTLHDKIQASLPLSPIQLLYRAHMERADFMAESRPFSLSLVQLIYRAHIVKADYGTMQAFLSLSLSYTASVQSSYREGGLYDRMHAPLSYTASIQSSYAEGRLQDKPYPPLYSLYIELIQRRHIPWQDAGLSPTQFPSRAHVGKANSMTESRPLSLSLLYSCYKKLIQRRQTPWKDEGVSLLYSFYMELVQRRQTPGRLYGKMQASVSLSAIQFLYRAHIEKADFLAICRLLFPIQLLYRAYIEKAHFIARCRPMHPTLSLALLYSCYMEFIWKRHTP